MFLIVFKKKETVQELLYNKDFNNNKKDVINAFEPIIYIINYTKKLTTYKYKLTLEKKYYCNLFIIYCEESELIKDCCSKCGNKCTSIRYCNGILYDDFYNTEYEICELSNDYLLSLFIFKIICYNLTGKQLIKKNKKYKIKQTTYIKLFNKLQSKLDSLVINKIITYL